MPLRAAANLLGLLYGWRVPQTSELASDKGSYNEQTS